MEMITTWYGEPIKNLSRSELIAAINHLASELNAHRTPAAMRAHALGCVEMLKKGEKRYP